MTPEQAAKIAFDSRGYVVIQLKGSAELKSVVSLQTYSDPATGLVPTDTKVVVKSETDAADFHAQRALLFPDLPLIPLPTDRRFYRVEAE